jgi:hypothetical protein
MDFGFEAGIGFFLALALCFGVCKIVMVIGRAVAHDIALFRRTRLSRSLSKSMEKSFHRHAWDPLDSYEWALRDVAKLEQYLSTLPPNEEASATAAQLVAQAKAVQAVCERALRIERIADILDSNEADERMVAAGDTSLDGIFALSEADRIWLREKRTADLVAAKKGPLTWWKPDSGYRDANGKVHCLGPRGLGLSPALIAKAEAELDGYRSFAPGEIENCPDTFSGNVSLIATAAHRIFGRHQPSWLR